MNEKRADPKAVLREIASKGTDPGGPHVGSKRLIAYRQGTLPEAEREAVQEHLSLCARCTGLLRELREFETAAAEDATGPDPLREEAWQALVRRLPAKAPVIRPVDSATRLERPRESPAWSARVWPAYAAAAALLLAIGGLAAWQAVSVGQERQKLVSLERRLEDREEILATVQRSAEETRRQLDAARARIHDLETQAGRARQESGREAELEARVAELTSEVAALRRTAPEDRIAAAGDVEVAISPRFILRGEEPPGGDLLRAGGAANRVELESGRVSVALDLDDLSASSEVRFELLDRAGRVLWSGRRPGDSLVGDDGTLVTIQGLAPGRYRLRVESVGNPAPRAGYLLDIVDSAE